MEGVKDAHSQGRHDAGACMELAGRPGVSICVDELRRAKEANQELSGVPAVRIVTVPTTDYAVGKEDPACMEKMVEDCIGDIIDYDINGNTLTFTVPEGMTDGKVVLTQNAYITADAIIEVRKLTGVIWMGKEDLTGWSNFGVFNWDGDKWTKFQEAISGAGELTVHFKQISDNPAMFADGGKGFVIWGDGIQLQYIKFIASGAAKDLADYIKNMDGSGIVYPYGFTWDDTGRFILSKEFLLETIGVQSGWVFEVYKEKSSTGQVQINNSSWSALYTIADWNGTEEVLVQPFDAVMMEAVNNGGLVIQGDLKGVTKLTIHP